jgi:hypothetical protein
MGMQQMPLRLQWTIPPMRVGRTSLSENDAGGMLVPPAFRPTAGEELSFEVLHRTDETRFAIRVL